MHRNRDVIMYRQPMAIIFAITLCKPHPSIEIFPRSSAFYSSVPSRGWTPHRRPLSRLRNCNDHVVEVPPICGPNPPPAIVRNTGPVQPCSVRHTARPLPYSAATRKPAFFCPGIIAMHFAHSSSSRGIARSRLRPKRVERQVNLGAGILLNSKYSALTDITTKSQFVGTVTNVRKYFTRQHERISRSRRNTD
jgi:hypothetical protein